MHASAQPTIPPAGKQQRSSQSLKKNKPLSLPSSYRPISLLPSLAKVLDSLVLQKILEVVDERNLISDFQYGFRQSHSTTQQLFRVCEMVTTNFNRGLYTGFVSLDLEKAFDKVWHPGLLYKLLVQGYSMRMIKMIMSYLSNRNFRVVVQGESSPSLPILSGVPQGSALGPILFTLYTSSIPTPTDHRTTLALYADDTAIIGYSRSPELLTELLQAAVDQVVDYYDDWGLHVNPSKTAYLVMAKKHGAGPGQYTIDIENEYVNNVGAVKYLGLYLDGRLNLTKHTQDRIAKARGRLGQIGWILKAAPPEIATRLYCAHIRPILTYATPAWYSIANRGNANKMQICQNRALRLATNLTTRTRINTLHNIAGVPLIEDFVNYRLIPNFANTLRISDNPT